MGEDSERAAGDRQLEEGLDAEARLAALAVVIPALAHRLNNGLLPIVGLGELVLTQPDSPSIARIAATADERGRLVVQSIKALSELAKPATEGAAQVDARAALAAAELLLGPLAEARATDLRVAAPDELPTRVDSRALLHWLVTCGADALEGPDPRLRLRVRRRADRWWWDVLGTRTEAARRFDFAGEPVLERARGRVLRRRLELPAFGEPATVEQAAPDRRAAVLVFERDPELAELLEAVLGEAGFIPRIAADAATAESLAGAEEFDLLLLSPGASARDQLSDLELADRLRPRFSTAVGVIGPEAVARRLGAPRALPREFRPGELLAYLDELLAGA
ncbi:MAG: hypothetical protein AAFZ65_08000 [Planctomycetota bacterium]